MRCSNAGAVVAVIELIKKDQVSPVWILLEFPGPAIHRSLSMLVTREDSDHAIGNFTSDFEQAHLAASVARNADLEVIAITCSQRAQRFDNQKSRREPDWSAPIGIAPLDLVFRLGRIVS